MREQSVTAAKERLKCMIHYENNILDEETMGYIRRDIGNVITKYVDVEPENIEIKVILKEYKKRELQCLNTTLFPKSECSTNLPHCSMVNRAKELKTNTFNKP